ncbi:MAG: hypothetical protein GX616_24345, partial [Planctomycetes bacterium]|nr:hypothetical protein [Planctomycetota bacterium]
MVDAGPPQPVERTLKKSCLTFIDPHVGFFLHVNRSHSGSVLSDESMSVSSHSAQRIRNLPAGEIPDCSPTCIGVSSSVSRHSHGSVNGPATKGKGRSMKKLILAMLVGVGLGTFAVNAGDNGSLPWDDDFEGYTNNEPLVDGTNGWYASSADVVVQDGVGKSSTKGAVIPVDCTLSNRFSGLGSDNVWLQMDVKPSIYDGANPPAVDPNVALMFYVNSNGQFMVHDGTPTNWVDTQKPSPGISTSAPPWVTLRIFQNFSTKKWDLYADGTEVMTNIGFINTSITNFAGFDVYNGASSTSYLDNIVVSNEAAEPPSSAPTGTHAIAGYVPGSASIQTAVVDCTFAWPESKTLMELIIVPTLPDGWTLGENAWGDGDPEIQPASEDILMTGSFTTNPLVFHYEVVIPASEEGVQVISNAFSYKYSGDDSFSEADVTPETLDAKMLVTLAAEAKNKTFGNADPALTWVTNSGVVLGGDSVTGALERVAGETVAGSPYEIQQGSLGIDSEDYVLTYVPANFTIDALAVQVHGTRQYDGTTTAAAADLDVTNKVTGYTDVDLASGSGTLAGKGIGEQAISAFGDLALGGTDAGNYTLTGASGSMTITQRPIEITADNDSKVYDGTPLTDSGYTQTSGTLASGDSLDSVTVTGSQTDVGVSSNTPSAAVISDSGSQDMTANYDITYVQGALEVTAKELTVTVTKVYDGDANIDAAECSLVGVVGGDTVTLDVLTGTYDAGADVQTAGA